MLTHEMDIPDDLLREAAAIAHEDGKSVEDLLRELVAEGLARRLERSPGSVGVTRVALLDEASCPIVQP